MTALRRPTRRQLEVLRAYVGAGSIKLAAHRLGISESTARQHPAALYRRTGSHNAVQAAYLLGATRRQGCIAAHILSGAMSGPNGT